jgi:hypothetical protein
MFHHPELDPSSNKRNAIGEWAKVPPARTAAAMNAVSANSAWVAPCSRARFV